MQVTLTLALEALIRRKVGSGLYVDASDVVRDALRLLAARDEAEAMRLDVLRRALVEGETSRLAAGFSFDRLNAHLDVETGARLAFGRGLSTYANDPQSSPLRNSRNT
ncbi:MAG: type II toxin-antitoxin system ParD family antitoxin [Alphaproteobacteria bacterium]|nr:type II toxin-antitoxin system ParD family antitoxin [Alphaproteobacteria bacterium]